MNYLNLVMALIVSYVIIVSLSYIYNKKRTKEYTKIKRNNVFLSNARVMSNPVDLCFGLMFMKVPANYGYVFSREEAMSDYILMYFVKEPLDIILLDNEKRVVDIIYRAVPNQKPIKTSVKFNHMIEARHGYCYYYSIDIGDKLTF